MHAARRINLSETSNRNMLVMTNECRVFQQFRCKFVALILRRADLNPARKPAYREAEQITATVQEQPRDNQTSSVDSSDITVNSCSGDSLTITCSEPLRISELPSALEFRETRAGRSRHLRITGSCVALSLAIFSMCLADLTVLNEKPVMIDSNFKTHPRKVLEADCSFVEPDRLALTEKLHLVWSRTGSYKYGYSHDCSYGFVDGDLKQALPMIYSEALPFSEGLAAVKRSGANVTKGWEYIDQTGKNVIPARFTEAGSFHGGVAPVTISVNGTTRGALIDKAGKIIANNESESIPTRHNNLYRLTTKTEKVGLVNTCGKFVLPPVFSRIQSLQQIEADPNYQPYRSRIARENDRYVKVFKPLKYSTGSKITDEVCGLYDTKCDTDRLLLTPQFIDITSFRNGFAVVKKKVGASEQWGVIGVDGKYLLEPKYDFITPYGKLIAARDENGWKVFDLHGHLLNIKIDGAVADRYTDWVSEGLAGVIVGDKCGFIDTKGKLVIPAIYEIVKPFSGGYAAVLSNGLWTYIDKSGTTVSHDRYSSATNFVDGKATASIAGPFYEFLNGTTSASYVLDRMKEGYQEKLVECPIWE